MAPAAIETFEHYAPIVYHKQPVTKCHTHVQFNGAKNSKKLVKDALRDHIRDIDTNNCEAGEDDAFFVCDVGDVYRQILRWKLNLQRIKPHYAVKCNPDPQILRLLAAMGCGFDVASKAEIDMVLKLGVDPSRLIYAQPCKTRSYIRHSAQKNVRQMTFDNKDELHKIKAIFPEAELYLRILTDDSSSLCRLSAKFGASLDSTQELLALGKELDLNVVGVSFHVGSGASDPQAFVKAVEDSRTVFDQAARLGFDFHTLDVGGGFVGDERFEEVARVLSDALDDNFPSNIRIIGEPGRYMVATAYTLACNIVARREVRDPATGEISYMLYLNDGVYGNFSNIIFDHQNPVPRILSTQSPQDNRHTTEYSLWGPTCDGIDKISEKSVFHEVLDVGDWLYFEEMGAYTMCSATRFNGFTDSHEITYVSSEPGASAILDC